MRTRRLGALALGAALFPCSLSAQVPYERGEMGSYLHKGEAEYVPVAYFTGGGETMRPGGETIGAVRALEAVSGVLRWEFRLLSPPSRG